MTLAHQIAKFVAPTLDPAIDDRYTQIWAIKSALIAHGKQILATDRETIDDTLDVLFYEYGFKG
jgi:hypothetical protein